VIQTLEVMKKYREKDNFFLRLASVLTNENKDFLPSFMNMTQQWSIDFHEVILIRDIPDEEQFKLKYIYKDLSEKQQKRSSKNWQKSFNGKLFDKLYKETIKRLDKKNNHSPCVAGSRFVEIFPDGVVRGCEVEKLWDMSTIGKIENKLDIIDILESKKAKDFANFAKKCSCTFECANAISTVYDKKHWPSFL
jgi:sulfatase maturation enzyme AslB (radical SAM superfamily)